MARKQAYKGARMQRVTTEQVTRTYCDVCNKDITRGTQIGAGMNQRDMDWITCSGYLSYHQGQQRPVRISCEDLAKLHHGNPNIFANLIEKTA